MEKYIQHPLLPFGRHDVDAHTLAFIKKMDENRIY